MFSTYGRTGQARGQVIFVRYVDDIVIGFQYEADAKSFWADLRQRMEQFALTLHPDKTRLLEFGRFAAKSRARQGLGKPETFDFLGFVHICGRTRNGTFQLSRRTRPDRPQSTIGAIKEELRKRMHDSIPEQGKWLGQVVRGYFNYHAVPTNRRSLQRFRYLVVDLWRRALRRRSQKDQTTWERITRLATDFLPAARILHPWPEARFAVTHPRWEPSA